MSAFYTTEMVLLLAKLDADDRDRLLTLISAKLAEYERMVQSTSEGWAALRARVLALEQKMDDALDFDDDEEENDMDEDAAVAGLPNVECTKHPGIRAPGYCVCVHVLDAEAPIAHYREASPRQLGEVFCEACITNVDAWKVGDLRYSCAQCVGELIATRAPKVEP